jgi:hypothetical protein
MPTNTSQKRPDHFLAAKHIEKFLVEWANTFAEYPDQFTETTKTQVRRADAAIARLVQRYPEFFAGLPEATPPAGSESKIPSEWWEVVGRTQDWLRLAWDAPDLRAREWFIFEARREYHYQTLVNPQVNARIQSSVLAGKDWQIHTAEEMALIRQAPPLGPFERALYHFQRIADRARRCGNPECPAPFFFAAKKGQKYCSSKCSAPSQREQKRRWWQENRAKNGGIE